MKTSVKISILLAFVLPWLCSCALQSKSGSFFGRTQKATVAMTLSNLGFATPESVEYYKAGDVYLVTNINGSPFDADDNGFISMLKPDGSLVALKWIDGTSAQVKLNAPKGMAIVEGKLYVADISEVQVFELPSGRQLNSIAIGGSSFLNGISEGPNGSVQVTDTGLKPDFSSSGTDAIHQVWADGKYKTILGNKEMGRPNGIIADGDAKTWVTFGSGKVWSLDKGGKPVELPTPPQGALDGLIRLQDGRLVTSSWNGSALYVLNKDNTYATLAENLDAPADLGLDTKRNRILVPLFKENKVVVVQL